MTLLAFAGAGLAVALLLPSRTPPQTASPSYALAISSGIDLRLAGRHAAAGTTSVAPGARVLACRRVVSLGALDIGARCRQGASNATGLVQGD